MFNYRVYCLCLDSKPVGLVCSLNEPLFSSAPNLVSQRAFEVDSQQNEAAGFHLELLPLTHVGSHLLIFTSVYVGIGSRHVCKGLGEENLDFLHLEPFRRSLPCLKSQSELSHSASESSRNAFVANIIYSFSGEERGQLYTYGSQAIFQSVFIITSWLVFFFFFFLKAAHWPAHGSIRN